MLVEDNDQVRKLSNDILRKQGYRILNAKNRTEALVVLSSYDNQIDLLITDYVMPEINEKRTVFPVLWKNIRTICPVIPAILQQTTGF